MTHQSKRVDVWLMCTLLATVIAFFFYQMQCFIPFIFRNEIDGSFPDWFIWPSLCELIHSGTFDKIVGIKIMLYTEHINTLLNEDWTERS